MNTAKDLTPKSITIRRTNAAVSDPGITYNQPGVTYNDTRYTYGGVYGQQDIFISPSFVFDIKSSQISLRTNKQLYDPGITYNQSGATFNDARYTYGGLYGQGDIMPIISLAQNIHPTVVGYADIYTTHGTAGSGIHTPIGLLLVLTHFKP